MKCNQALECIENMCFRTRDDTHSRHKCPRSVTLKLNTGNALRLSQSSVSQSVTSQGLLALSTQSLLTPVWQSPREGPEPRR